MVKSRQQRLKKQVAVATLLLSLLSPTANALIPVTDVASIARITAEGAARAQEFKKTIDNARDQFYEMKAQGDYYSDMVDGHFNFEDVLNDPNANAFMALDDWKAIYHDIEDIAELREEFDLFSDNPAVQRRYDRKLRQYKMQSQFYDSTVKRNNHMQDLLKQFNTASTPAAKADLANSINYEQVQLQNDNNMMASMDAMMEKQQRMEEEAAVRENTRALLHEGIPRHSL
ncbi:type IV secretion system protein [Photobacterium indicum]|uniref:type IV secretion system protein n=1 Tax=Photobacterium indicum TaxID=81447 RepID=UPI003D0D637C